MTDTIPVPNVDSAAAELYAAEVKGTSGSKDLGVLMSYAIFGDPDTWSPPWEPVPAEVCFLDTEDEGR